MTPTEELVLRAVADTVAQFVARPRDLLFPQVKLEQIVESGQVTKEQIKTWFMEELDKYF